ncbi:MAG: ribosome biogenesis GTPase YlqF [Algisphaera sp.]
MTIHWYPGHMNSTRKALEALMPKCDVVIELLDARIPGSSSNPLLDELRRDVVGKGPNGLNGDVPCVTLLTKRDLADPNATAAWRAYLRDTRGVKTLAVNLGEPKDIKNLPKLIKRCAPKKITEKGKKVRAVVVGIPNVGKSTLLNGLRGKRILGVGDEPGFTKQAREIDLKNGLVLWDTPGILWPKFDDPLVGYRVAVSGGVKDTAVDYDDIAMFAAKFLREHYPDRLRERYKIDDLPEEPGAMIEAIGAKRGCIVSGGQIHFNRACELLIRELRSGKLGRISLEWPPEAPDSPAEFEDAMDDTF